jgi:hypothetical protein
MTSEDEFTGLFTHYFGDKLSPAQIEALAVAVVAAQADRRTRLGAHSCAPGSQHVQDVQGRTGER